MLKLCSNKWIQLANKNYVNNVLRSSRGYSLSQISLKKYDDRRRQPSLIPYTEVDSSENHRNQVNKDVHLYPIEHDKHLSEPFEDSSALDNQRNNRKSLNVCVLGIPNAGKSTLINNIIGANACPHSKKAHTTRKLSNALLTEDNIQIVFSDTPGVVKPGDVQKFRLEETLIRDPVEATTAADLVIVLHDLSNRFTREAIDKGILKLLCYHAVNTPTILVINKLDLLKKDKDFRKSFYRVIEKLTCGHINGEPTRGDRVNENPSSSYTVDRYLKRKLKEQEKDLKDQSSDNKDIVKISSYQDFVQVIKTQELNENLVSQLTNGLFGWPLFQDVFAVSALDGSGVNELREFILSQGKANRQWLYHPQLRTTLPPQDLVIDIVKSKCLEVMIGPHPYKVKPKISFWKVENDVLRLNVQITTNKVTYKLMQKDVAQIAKLAEKDLQNFYGQPVFLLISLHCPAVERFDEELEKVQENKTKTIFNKNNLTNPKITSKPKTTVQESKPHILNNDIYFH